MMQVSAYIGSLFRTETTGPAIMCPLIQGGSIYRRIAHMIGHGHASLTVLAIEDLICMVVTMFSTFLRLSCLLLPYHA